MKLECPVCFNLLSEEPDLKFKPDPESVPPPVKKRRSQSRYRDGTDSPSTDGQSETAELAVTKCGHMFHKCCLLSWFATNPNCPTCRKPAPDGVEELRTVFLPTTNGEDSQILFRNTKGELEITKIHLETLIEENESLKTKVKELTNATAVKDQCSRKLQTDKDMMEACTEKLRDRYKRLWIQLSDLRKSYDLLKTRAKGLELEVTQLKRADLSQSGPVGGRGSGGRGRRGRRGRGGTASSNNSIVLIDLTDD